jgi:hypothetical protein
LLTEADFRRCSTGSVAICPADMAIYNGRTLTCELSLFLQTVYNNHLCWRSLLLHYIAPTLWKHGNTWLYHFPEKRQAIIRCPENEQASHTETHFGAGLILNASKCSITTNKVRTLPDLQGATQADLCTSHLYIPEELSIVAEHEVQLLQDATPTAIERLDEIQSRIMARQQTFDMDLLLHMRQTSLRQEHGTYWHFIFAKTFCAISVLIILLFSLRSYVHNLILCHYSMNTSSQQNVISQSSPPLDPSHKQEARKPKDSNLQKNVTFASYSLQKDT